VLGLAFAERRFIKVDLLLFLALPMLWIFAAYSNILGDKYTELNVEFLTTLRLRIQDCKIWTNFNVINQLNYEALDIYIPYGTRIYHNISRPTELNFVFPKFGCKKRRSYTICGSNKGKSLPNLEMTFKFGGGNWNYKFLLIMNLKLYVPALGRRLNLLGLLFDLWHMKPTLSLAITLN